MSEGEDDEEDAGSDEEGDNPFSGEFLLLCFCFYIAHCFALRTEQEPTCYLLCASLKKSVSFIGVTLVDMKVLNIHSG